MGLDEGFEEDFEDARFEVEVKVTKLEDAEAIEGWWDALGANEVLFDAKVARSPESGIFQ